MQNGIRIRTSSFTRHHVNITMTKAKSNGNYTNSILALQEALNDGYDEALLLDPEGYVAEGSGELMDKTGEAVGDSYEAAKEKTGEVYDSVKEQGGEMLESAQVFDNFYATSRSQVEKNLAAGHDVLLEIDWQGARQVRERMPEAVSVFILPPSRAELEKRLRGRGTDSDEVIERRLRDSVADMSHWREFDYVLVNDRFDESVAALAAIIRGEGEAHRRDRSGLAGLVEGIMAGPGATA